MGTIAEYFENRRHKPTYYPGDRVFGRFNKIPFIGTVGNDTLFNEEEGPILVINLDLPLKYKGNYHNVIRIKHKYVKLLKAL